MYIKSSIIKKFNYNEEGNHQLPPQLATLTLSASIKTIVRDKDYHEDYHI